MSLPNSTPGTRIKVLYCTCVPLTPMDNGGALGCWEHLQRLAADDSIALTVCTIGKQDHARDGALVASLGAEHYPLVAHSAGGLPGWTRLCPSWRWPLVHETTASANRQIDLEFMNLADRLRPDLVIVDYLFTALFIPSAFGSALRIAVITLNPEAVLYRETRRQGRVPSDVSNSIVAQWRLARFERAVYNASDAVVTLSEQDLPAGLNTGVTATVIPPILDQSPLRWRYTGTHRLFFIGNIAHFPNFLAIKWLAEEFAPALAQQCPDARVRIVGVDAKNVPAEWRLRNIEYVGAATQEQVEEFFIDCDLFIAPIEHFFGVKIKILQCLAHGTPILASRAALSGMPFADAVPQLSRADPTAAVRLAAELMSSEQRLMQLSRTLSEERDRLAQSRQGAWNELIRGLIARPVRSRSLPFWSPIRPCSTNLTDVSAPWPRSLEVGVTSPVGVTSTGLYPGESLDGQPMRWTARRAEIKIPLNQATLPNRMRLALHCITPADGTAYRVRVNGAELLQGLLHGHAVEEEHQLPPLSGTRYLLIELETSPWQGPGDPREFGIALRSIALLR